MPRSLAILLLLTMPILAADPPRREIVRTDKAAMNALLSADAVIEELGGEGFKWTEGPVWSQATKKLLFSDIPNNRILSWSEVEKFREVLKPSGYTASPEFTGREPGSNGLAYDKGGNLVLCQHGDRRIARLMNGKFETLADKFEGKRLNSPNDLVYHSNGDLYFTDPPYGLPGNDKDPAKELDFQGVFRLKPNGELTLLTKQLTRPNGIALSPDQKTLYVANSDPKKAQWYSFPVKDDGTLGESRIFADSTSVVSKDKPGLPDGLKVDASGNIWATGPGGVWIFNSDGKNIGMILTHVPTSNCAFGNDGSMLYITANDKLLRIRTKVKGS